MTVRVGGGLKLGVGGADTACGRFDSINEEPCRVEVAASIVRRFETAAGKALRAGGPGFGIVDSGRALGGRSLAKDNFRAGKGGGNACSSSSGSGFDWSP